MKQESGSCDRPSPPPVCDRSVPVSMGDRPSSPSLLFKTQSQAMINLNYPSRS
ncbi:MAG: hypothetical protein F6K30_14755 [Cyanothece sp. SIO2G6]|nr:hypothetical protein [Cyanothece sp. SIO2G6]